MLDYNFFNQKYSEATKETAHILSELLCISPYCKEIEKFKVNFIGEIFETFKDIDIEGLSFYCIYIEFETFF